MFGRIKQMYLFAVTFIKIHPMSSCQFSIPFSISPEHIVRKAKAAIQGQGGEYTGDEGTGNFSVNVLGSISGSYTISGQVMHVTIESKPMFIPCSQIEAFMKKQFGS